MTFKIIFACEYKNSTYKTSLRNEAMDSTDYHLMHLGKKKKKRHYN